MKIAVMILGLLGGLWSSVIAGGMAFAAYTGFALGGDPSVDYSSRVWFGLGLAALVLGLVAMAGGLLADRHRRASAAMLLVPGVLGLALVPVMWIPPGMLLIIGGILAAVNGRKKTATLT
jgi:hypothetical protein